MANAPIVVTEGDEDLEIEYDSDGYPIIPERSKVIDPLPPIDHSAVSCMNTHTHTHTHTQCMTIPPPPSQIEYPSFNRNFYEEHSNISSLSGGELRELKKKLGLKVSEWVLSHCKPVIVYSYVQELCCCLGDGVFPSSALRLICPLWI